MIEVTQKHIDKGVISCGDKCPIKLAISEVLPAYKRLYVTRLYIHFDGLLTYYNSVPLSIKASKFTRDFDRGIKVEPLKFRMRKPI